MVLRYVNDIPCKNYNYAFVFVKVIPKTLLVPFFSGHGVVAKFDMGIYRNISMSKEHGHSH